MEQFTIRPAEPGDLEAILQIYARARSFMADHGNPRQWNTTWPPEALVREDIAMGRSYVCVLQEQVVGVFVFFQGYDIDPTYRTILDGGWSADRAYGVVHRIASSGQVPGVGQFCLDWACRQSGYLRVDTHGDNQVMQNLLTKCGFTRCGIIYVEEDNDPRIAFDKEM